MADETDDETRFVNPMSIWTDDALFHTRQDTIAGQMIRGYYKWGTYPYLNTPLPAIPLPAV
jgi:hypothetical protein